MVAADGEKLSKRKKNYAPMDEIFDQYGVDSLRFFMASSPIVNGEDVRFSTDFLRDVQRKVFMTLNNILSFYKLYADVDGFKPTAPLVEPASTNVLDQWMLARLDQATNEVTEAMDQYRLDRATRPLTELLDDCSNWYVRRSRRRFWKSEDDADKHQAYQTLHYTLLRICQLLAPFSPFLPDYIWQQLVTGTDLPTSVHLSDWPKSDQIDSKVLEQMHQAREVINQALAQRAEAGIKARQPLAELTVFAETDQFSTDLQAIIADEVNVKKITIMPPKTNQHCQLDVQLTPELSREGLMREVVRLVQASRKKAGLQVDDRIELGLVTDDDELKKAITEHHKTIVAETLATKLDDSHHQQYSVDSKLGQASLTISLKKA